MQENLFYGTSGKEYKKCVHAFTLKDCGVLLKGNGVYFMFTELKYDCLLECIDQYSTHHI